jgi:hypothetical protein
VVFAAVIVTCLLRLASNGRRPGYPRRADDLSHVVMSVSMIAMVLSWTRVLPTFLWVLLFGGQAVLFAVTLLRRSGTSGPAGQDSWDHTHHMMAGFGMVYMIVVISGSGAIAGGSAMVGMSMGGTMSPLAGAFGVYFLIYAVWSGLRATRLVPVAATSPNAPAVLGRPLAVHGCRALMGAGMAYMMLA